MSHLDDWIAALESGEYKQAKYVLHRVDDDEHSFCCLGVLCELAVADGAPVSPQATKTEIVHGNLHETEVDVVAYSGETGHTPDTVLEWLKLDLELDESRLIQMNDYGCTFKEIAQHLRENYS